MFDVKQYLYDKGSSFGACKAQGEAHYQLYKATMEECKAMLHQPEAYFELAAHVRAFFADEEGRQLLHRLCVHRYSSGLAGPFV